MNGKAQQAIRLMSGKGKDFPKRGEIYWVNLDPAVGSETKKTRPALIVSNDIGNENSDGVIAAPITSKVKNIYPFEVEVIVSGKPAKIMVNQCRPIDKSRLTEKISSIDQTIMKAVEESLKIVFGLN
jgi:mRNA interferase MazF